ncbi:MAG: hypothetical protein FJ267_18685 [Planctomycetes bacterium]|nr:hypothetical protein [Planctomycetota bacterium]
MSYFSRLTDIVSCNLTQLLNEATDPRLAIVEIIREMEEGLAGAERSVATATNSEQRLHQELDEHRTAAEGWKAKAVEFLKSQSESEARECLVRKQEIEDVVAGIEQQHKAAIATREHMATIHRALQARLSEARRKQDSLNVAENLPASSATGHSENLFGRPNADNRQEQIDQELEALKREMGR